MYVVVPICCFCEQVLDEDVGGAAPRWVPLKDYRAKYGLLAGEVWVSHTECPSCSGQYAELMAHSSAAAHTLSA
ncbi:hypothetical protein [Nitrospira moscoviensis]|uniref:Uncharacterized protein n=1 Tax=Nitrospira moscoviensis TaxID=42253 RepID=A0A0K2GBU8_NITMO|nr:hypothetical protein [Nitrospira moscoviensis]ALA58426.1 hypothetical protein NITMOv2_2009 [Nitrospira moscoviensis]